MRTETRLIIASNRLPFTVQTRDGALTLQTACGGLAAALRAVHKHGRNVWIGWPGSCEGLSTDERSRVQRRLRDERVVPVALSDADVAAYYDGICNSVLWPTFHYMIDRLPLRLPDFAAYRAVNERFADIVARQYEPGDIIWIHDYHLLLVPAMLRRCLPEAHIGFFLHTPFPAADVFRILPWGRELLDGALGSTLIGFQTERDVHNFADTIRTLTEYCTEGRTVIADDREVRFGPYPIGVDTTRLDVSAGTDDGTTPVPAGAAGGRRLFLGVDRLDYTKGIPRRLAAFDRLLECHPHLRGRVDLLQVGVPSRTHVPSYVAYKQEVDALVEAINTRYGGDGWVPVRYVAEALQPADLSRLYREADVMLVTSLRDGMNLVAKEFVLARDDEDGVLILSDLAGASEELREAVLVHPYSVEELAAAMADALSTDREGRRRQMRALRRRVAQGPVDTWVERFTTDLARASSAAAAPLERVLSALRTGASTGEDVSLVFLYEDVLVPTGPGSLHPDPELADLLRRLRSRPGLAVHVVSTFSHDVLDAWFESVPATLWAENGLWRRERDGHRWRRTQWTSTQWASDVRELLESFGARTPGAFVEERGSSLLWHFGRCDHIHGQTQAQMLGAILEEAGGTLGFMVIQREGVIEVRPEGLTLERTLQKLLECRARDGRVILFTTPESAAGARKVLSRRDLIVTVGDAHMQGDVSLAGARAVRVVLRELLGATPAAAIDAVPPTRSAPLRSYTPEASGRVHTFGP